MLPSVQMGQNPPVRFVVPSGHAWKGATQPEPGEGGSKFDKQIPGVQLPEPSGMVFAPPARAKRTSLTESCNERAIWARYVEGSENSRKASYKTNDSDLHCEQFLNVTI